MTAAIIAICVAFYFSWSLTLVVICTVPVIYLAEAYLSKRLNTRTHEQAAQLQTAMKYITNAVQSIETVKCYNGQNHELQAFTKATSLAASLYKRVANLRSMQIGLIQFFTFTVFVQGFAYGSYLIRAGKIDISSVITTFWAALLAIGGITGFLPQFIVMQKGKVSGSRLRAMMQQTSREDTSLERQGGFKPAECLGDIEFRHVNHYDTTRLQSPADELGHLLLSYANRRDRSSRRDDLLSSRRNHFRYRQKWLGQEHPWAITSPVLPADFRSDLPRPCTAQRVGRPLVATKCYACRAAQRPV